MFRLRAALAALILVVLPVALLAGPGPALFGGRSGAIYTPATPGSVLGAGTSSPASLDFDFANGRYWQASVYGRDPSSLLTVSRASTEYQANAAGILIPFPSNVAAITQGVGLGVWQAATNLALWSRDLTNAVWTASNVTVAKTATGADGLANSASLLTATGANGTVEQPFTLSSTAQVVSAYVERVTGSGEIDITLNGGTSWTNIASLINTSSYVRVPAAGLSATLANPKIGFRIVTSGDAINVDFIQLQNGTFPTPPIPTTSTTTASAADAISVKAFPAVGPFWSFFSGTPGSPTAYATNQKFFSSTGAVDLGARRTASTGTVAVISGGLTGAAWNQNTPGKVAYALANGAQAMSFNAGALVTASGAIAPLAGGYSTTMSIGSSAGASVFWNGLMTRIAFGSNTYPPGTFLQQITH